MLTDKRGDYSEAGLECNYTDYNYIQNARRGDCSKKSIMMKRGVSTCYLRGRATYVSRDKAYQMHERYSYNYKRR